MSRFEFGIAAATTVAVIAFGVLEALVIAVALSIVDVVRRSARVAPAAWLAGGFPSPFVVRSFAALKDDGVR